MVDVTTDNKMEKPELTFPPEESALIREAYAKADVILEYGSGGSTVLAAEMEGKTVFSVENDKFWARSMRRYFIQNPPKSSVEMIWIDTGKTKKWGWPANTDKWMNYAKYPLQVWDREDFMQPDVVLIDGRFRIGCALATLYRTKKPVTVYIDDYVGRNRYRVIENYLGEPVFTGRIAKFIVKPNKFPAEKMLEIVQLMIAP